MALGVHSESPDIDWIPAQDTVGILDVISTPKTLKLALEVLSDHKVWFLIFYAIDTQSKFYFYPK